MKLASLVVAKIGLLLVACGLLADAEHTNSGCWGYWEKCDSPPVTLVSSDFADACSTISAVEDNVKYKIVCLSDDLTACVEETPTKSQTRGYCSTGRAAYVIAGYTACATAVSMQKPKLVIAPVGRSVAIPQDAFIQTSVSGSSQYVANLRGCSRSERVELLSVKLRSGGAPFKASIKYVDEQYENGYTVWTSSTEDCGYSVNEAIVQLGSRASQYPKYVNPVVQVTCGDVQDCDVSHEILASCVAKSEASSPSLTMQSLSSSS